MPNQHILRGGFLLIVALFFGLGALRYPIGDLSRAGAGLFPLLVSGLLFVLALLMFLQARFAEAVPAQFNLRNIALIMLALAGFVLGAKFINMIAAIVLLVFIASFAATSRSWLRSLQIAAGLILVAIAFQKLLGLNLRVI